MGPVSLNWPHSGHNLDGATCSGAPQLMDHATAVAGCQALAKEANRARRSGQTSCAKETNRTDYAHLANTGDGPTQTYQISWKRMGTLILTVMGLPSL